MIYVFGACVLDTQRHVLRCATQPVRIRRKVFQVLSYLLVHRERMITKQELCEQLWPGQFISDAALESTIKAVRQAIGDSGQRQTLIQTVYGQGYRFIATVEEGPESPDTPGADDGSPLPPRSPASQLIPSAPSSAPHSGLPAPLDRQGASDEPRVPWHERPLEGEWKLVSVLCGTLAGAAVPNSLRRDLLALAESTVQRYGGTLQPLMSEQMLAVFGAPQAQEDHAHRAVLAALELQQRLTSCAGTPAAQIGIHTGAVTVRQMQQPLARSIDVIGEAVRTVMLLQKHAAPGTILCSATTARLIRGTARLAAVEPVEVDDRPSPLQAHTVLGLRRQRRSSAVRQPRVWTPFVGRARELETVFALWEQVQEGRGQVVGIVGDPGIGKSRLLDEFRLRLRGQPVSYLMGYCRAHGQATPYLPLLELLRQFGGLTERSSATAITMKLHTSLRAFGLAPELLLPYLGQLLGLPVAPELLSTLSPQAIKSRTVEALVELALRGAQRRPLVLAIENMHWIDPSSEEVLAALIERLAGARVLLLLTYRPGYQPPWMGRSYATQLALTRLSARASRQVVQAIMRQTPVPVTVEQGILRRAEGNPLFLEELALAILEQGDLLQTPALPPTIQAVLAARIDRLPPSEKRLLQAASVVGNTVAVSLLLAVADMPESMLQQHLAHLQALELLYETTRLDEPALTFKHALTREAAYQSLLHGRRQEYHQQIAHMLAERLPEMAAMQPELLAYHYTEAGLSEYAVRAWQRAGRRAAERSAHQEAIEHLTKGLQVVTTLPDTMERAQHELTLQIALGRSLMAMQGYSAPEVGQAYVRARALCQQLGAPLQLFSVLRGLWVFYYMRAEFQTAQDLGEQCLRLAEHVQHPDLLQRAHQSLGTTFYFRGEFARARLHLEEGIRYHAAVPHRSRTIRAVQDSGVTCFSLLGLQLWYLGYPDQALRQSTEALTLARDLSHPFSLAEALFFTGVIHLLRREAAAAHECLTAVLTLATEQGFPHWVTLATTLLGWTLVAQGRGHEGITHLRQGLQAWRATGGEAARPWLLALLAESYGRLSMEQLGLAVVAVGLTSVQRAEERQPEAELLRLKGELLLAQSMANHAEVEACFQQALRIAREQQAKSLELRVTVRLCRLWRCQGKHAEAHHLLGAAYRWFTEGFDTADLQEAKALLEAP